MPKGSRRITITIDIDDDVASGMEELSSRIGVDLERLTSIILDVLSSYKGLILEFSSKLRVKKENIPHSVFEEIIYYGVEAWRGIVDPILRRLRASGRFELEMLELDPEAPSIELEFVALEGSDLRADRLRIHWTMDGVTMEVYYYLEEGEQPYHAAVDLSWDYLPDENAVVVTLRGSSIGELPPIHVIDKKVEQLLGG